MNNYGSNTDPWGAQQTVFFRCEVINIYILNPST